MYRLIKAYGIGAIAGIINELVVSKGKHHCIQHFDFKCIISAIFLNLYGWTTLIAVLFLDRIHRYNWSFILKLLILTIMLIVVECVGGQISRKIHKHQTWKYDNSFIPFCDGYCSAVTTVYFIILLILFIKFVYPRL